MPTFAESRLTALDGRRFPAERDAAAPRLFEDALAPVELVLFDVDGTLVRPGCALQRAHMEAMSWAIAAVTGTTEEFVYDGANLRYGAIDLSGFTDAGTIDVALRLQGLSDQVVSRLLPQVVDGMVGRLPDAPDAPCPDDLLPGAATLLAGLVAAGFRVGLSTGNARAVAHWKMRRLGLAALVRDGGFGDTARQRVEVVAAGITALAVSAPYRGVVVGDTASDVRAAHRAGLRCLAVTTGAASAAELRAAGADAVLPGLHHAATVGTIQMLVASSSYQHPSGEISGGIGSRRDRAGAGGGRRLLSPGTTEPQERRIAPASRPAQAQ